MENVLNILKEHKERLLVLSNNQVTKQLIKDTDEAILELQNFSNCNGCKWQHESGGRDYHSGICEACHRGLQDKFEV